jgi:hypothetical protein
MAFLALMASASLNFGLNESIRSFDHFIVRLEMFVIFRGRRVRRLGLGRVRGAK